LAVDTSPVHETISNLRARNVWLGSAISLLIMEQQAV
jgi:hypothetical protein